MELNTEWTVFKRHNTNCIVRSVVSALTIMDRSISCHFCFLPYEGFVEVSLKALLHMATFMQLAQSQFRSISSYETIT